MTSDALRQWLREIIDENEHLRYEILRLKALVGERTTVTVKEDRQARRRASWRAYYYRNREARVAATVERRRAKARAA